MSQNRPPSKRRLSFPFKPTKRTKIHPNHRLSNLARSSHPSLGQVQDPPVEVIHRLVPQFAVGKSKPLLDFSRICLEGTRATSKKTRMQPTVGGICSGAWTPLLSSAPCWALLFVVPDRLFLSQGASRRCRGSGHRRTCWRARGAAEER